MAHGFALALVLVILWCDGASMLRPFAFVCLETRVQMSVWGCSLTSMRSCGSAVAGAGLARRVQSCDVTTTEEASCGCNKKNMVAGPV